MKLDKEWYSPEEVATYFDLEADTIRKLCREHKIPGARQIGRSWRIPRSYLLGREPEDQNDQEHRPRK